jgi:hypothetical protein
MAFLSQLWLPILLSALFVFFMSAAFWMISPHHQKDWGKLPSEATVLAALRAQPAQPGLYTIPGCNDPAERRDPAWRAEVERGPIAYVTLRAGGMPNMGAQMFLSYVGNVVVSVFVAYIASHTIQPGAHYLEVFRVVGTLGFMSYALASLQDSVWFGRPWPQFYKQCFDALVFGCLMGGTFGWLWK